MENSSEAKNLRVSSWKDRFSLLFLSKSAYIFYITFVSLNVIIFLIYFFNLTTFALNIKEFTIADSAKYYSTTLLSERFSCSSKANYFLCGADVWLFFLLILFIEIFAIRKAILFRKKITKLTLFLYIFVMQVFAVIALLILAYTPEVAVANLSRKAEGEIKKSIAILNNPNEINKAGVETSPDEIASKIKLSSLENFSIAESNPLKGAVLSYLKIPKKGKDTLYRTLIIPYQLHYSENIKKTKLSFDIVLFPDNTLVINRISKESIEELVPVMASEMVAVEFRTTTGRKTPDILFLSDKEYNTYQKRQEEKVKKEQENNIAYLENYIKESDGKIQTNQNIINSYPSDKQKYQKEYEDYVAKWGGWYQACKRDFGDDPECETGKSTIDTSIRNIQSDIRLVEENKNLAEQNLRLLPIYKNEAIGYLAIAKKNYQDFLKFPITAEFQDGVFNSPDTIYIRLYDGENKPLSFYLNTTLHEYLHFYSYDPDFASLPNYGLDSFLDEGFTDYLRLVVGSKYIEPDYLVPAYPDEVEIIDELTKHFPKEKLIQFYIDKNQTAFQRLFVDTYSPLDYENFALKGKNLFYAPLKDGELRKKYVGEIKAILSKNKANSNDSTQ